MVQLSLRIGQSPVQGGLPIGGRPRGEIQGVDVTRQVAKSTVQSTLQGFGGAVQHTLGIARGEGWKDPLRKLFAKASGGIPWNGTGEVVYGEDAHAAGCAQGHFGAGCCIPRIKGIRQGAGSKGRGDRASDIAADVPDKFQRKGGVLCLSGREKGWAVFGPVVAGDVHIGRTGVRKKARAVGLWVGIEIRLVVRLSIVTRYIVLRVQDGKYRTIPGRLAQEVFRAYFLKAAGEEHFFGPLAHTARAGEDDFPGSFGMSVQVCFEIGHPAKISGRR